MLLFHISAYGINMKILLITISIEIIICLIITKIRKNLQIEFKYLIYLITFETIFLLCSLIMVKFLFLSNVFVICGIGLSTLLIITYIAKNLTKNKLAIKIFQLFLYLIMFLSTILIFSVIMKFIITF